MSLYSRLDRLAADVEKLNRQVTAVANSPQSQRTSVEGGSIDFNDADGNLMAIMGGQDDGSNTIRHVDGPTPPIPSGLSAHVDGPIVQVSWDGTFEDADEATYDWSHLEVVAVGPDNTNLRATINDVTGATANLAATVSGEWVVVARSVSRAEKRSLDGDAGTVEVKLVDIDGAIEAVQDSANGKNKVTYSDRPPTPDDPGIFDDTWFVGQVGRPNDVVEATNYVTNPSLEADASGWSPYSWTGSGARTQGQGAVGGWFYRLTAAATLTGAKGRYHDVPAPVKSGETWTLSIHVRPSRTITMQAQGEFRNSAGAVGPVSQAGPSISCPANQWTRIYLTITATGDATTIRFQNYLLGATLQSGDTLDLDGEVIALGQLAAYFDGDTPSGETSNESHYRWTGEPHASTSEKYLPALNIGDSDNWNIIEQYRHDGTGWVKVELSHYVFSSVDLGKATVGELDGIRIMGQTIRGEQLSGDAIDGKVITAPTIQSARSGRRWIGDPNGIRIINEDNDVRTQLSPGGSTFKGEVEADTLVVNEGAEFKGNNTLGQGAKLTLAAGVTDPTSPPVVQPYWDGLEFDLTWAVTELAGLAFDGTNYWTVKATGSWTDGERSGLRVARIAPSGDTSLFTLDSDGAGFSEFYGVTCIGSELFWLYRSAYNHKVLVTDLNCVKLREFPYADAGHSTSNPLTYKPGIGNDGTNIVIAHCNDGGPLNIRTFNKTTGAVLSRVIDYNDGTKSDITGVYVGNADWGRKLVTVAKKSTGKLPSFSATTGVYDGAVTQFDAAAPDSVGVVFHDGKFHTLAPSGVIHEYAGINTGDGSGDWWAGYGWWKDVDSDLLAETSDYQSRMSPPARFTWPRRAGIKIVGQPMPTGADYLIPWLAKKTTAPVRTDFHGTSWDFDGDKPVALITALPPDWSNTISPPEVNTFPEGTSSVLESASGTFLVRGDGSGHWGPLTMGRNGIMSGLVVYGEQVGTVDAINTPKKTAVTFPSGRFTKPPVVWVIPSTGRPYQVFASVLTEDITASAFQFSLARTNNTANTTVRWFAMDSE